MNIKYLISIKLLISICVFLVAVNGQAATPLGGGCTLHTDCENWGAGGVGCCGYTCQTLGKDYLGIKWCPDDCVGDPAKGHGTCQKIDIGGNCNNNAECKNPGWCCSGKCKTRQQDYNGDWLCPEVCVGWPLKPPGTCKN
ncbi:MAG TPA: hypothetical protein VEL47_02200 [Myxococcota bacterium]|nr:hypothetical protein [Myxococcota bacterium]